MGQQSSDFLKVRVHLRGNEDVMDEHKLRRQPISERKGNISSFFSKPSATKEKKHEKSSSPKREPSLSPSANRKKASAIPQAGEQAGEQAGSKGEEEKQNIHGEELVLNPDDAEKIKPESQADTEDASQKPILLDEGTGPREASHVDAGDASQKPIVLDDESGSGEAQEPIVVDESDVEDGKQDSARPSSLPIASSSKRKRRKSSTGREEKVDSVGNEKLTNFFEVLDDD